MEVWELKQRQSLPLEAKIILSQQRIRQWYEAWDGDVYVSFSGGKDSTVLLDLVRQLYPDVPAVFADTGLEYPEIREFVRTKENVTWIRPEMTFNQVIKKYGYPVISKEQSQKIREARHTKSDKLRDLRIHGRDGKFAINAKWLKLLDAPFEISERCCHILKKKPFHIYERETKRKPIIGTMTCESRLRLTEYLRSGCNSFEGKQISKPMSFWTEQDVLQYIINNDEPYATIYGDIIPNSKGLTTTGVSRTGCMFCMFGVHLEKGENRFQQMALTHPKQYDYCINKLGLGEVLDYIGVDYRRNNLFG